MGRRTCVTPAPSTARETLARLGALPGVRLLKESARRYPEGTLAAYREAVA